MSNTLLTPETSPDGQPPAVDEHSSPEPNPVVRLVCAALGLVAAVGVAALIGSDRDLVAAVAFVAVLAVISAVDIERMRVPNAIVVPAAAAALVWQAAFHTGDLLECVIAGAAAGLFFGIASLLTRGAVGMGDAKLALLIGLVMGTGVVSALFAATLAGAIGAAVVLWREGGAGRKRPMPYAPFLAGGAVVALLAGVGTPLT